MKKVIDVALVLKARVLKFVRSVRAGSWLTMAILFLFLNQVSFGFARCAGYLVAMLVCSSLYVWATKHHYYQWGYRYGVDVSGKRSYTNGMSEVNGAVLRLVEYINCAGSQNGVKSHGLSWCLVTDVSSRQLGAVLRIGNVAYSLRGYELWAKVGDEPEVSIYAPYRSSEAA